MAGVKGRSGGARPNSGPKPRPPKEPDVVADQEPLEFLRGVMLGRIDANPAQLKAAIAAAKYVHRPADGAGKKDERADAAKKAASGKFAAAQPPRLVSSR